MRVLDPGHQFTLRSLDGGEEQTLTFVKRDTPPERYPGNVGHHGGTTIQEVLRALIARAEYVNEQIPCDETQSAIDHLRAAIVYLERRAARVHGRQLAPWSGAIEDQPTCEQCGHIQCAGHP